MISPLSHLTNPQLSTRGDVCIMKLSKHFTVVYDGLSLSSMCAAAAENTLASEHSECAELPGKHGDSAACEDSTLQTRGVRIH